MADEVVRNQFSELLNHYVEANFKVEDTRELLATCINERNDLLHQLRTKMEETGLSWSSFTEDTVMEVRHREAAKLAHPKHDGARDGSKPARG